MHHKQNKLRKKSIVLKCWRLQTLRLEPDLNPKVSVRISYILDYKLLWNMSSNGQRIKRPIKQEKKKTSTSDQTAKNSKKGGNYIENVNSVAPLECWHLLMFVPWMRQLPVYHSFQFQKSYPEVYRNRFPTEESRAAVIPEKSSRFRPPLLFLKKPLQPFQRSWSFRAWCTTTSFCRNISASCSHALFQYLYCSLHLCSKRESVFVVLLQRTMNKRFLQCKETEHDWK